MKSDVSDVTNSIQLPGKTKMYLKTWNGGSNESFLDFVMTSLGFIKRLGHWKKLKEAADAVLEAEELVQDTKTAYKDAKERVQDATSDDEEADEETQQANLVLLVNRDDAKQAYQAAQADPNTTQEKSNDVAEKPFDKPLGAR
jgi:hypothetical protein